MADHPRPREYAHTGLALSDKTSWSLRTLHIRIHRRARITWLVRNCPAQDRQRQTDKQVSVCVDVGPREKGGDLSWPQTDCNQIAACPHPPTQTRPLVTLLIRQPSICAEGTNALSPTISVRPRGQVMDQRTLALAHSRSSHFHTTPPATSGSRSKHEPYFYVAECTSKSLAGYNERNTTRARNCRSDWRQW